MAVPAGTVSSLTVACRLRVDVAVADAQRVLTALPEGADSPFAVSDRTHFARLQIISAVTTHRRRPLDAGVLILSVDVDGDARAYLVDLLSGAGTVLAPVLALCDGAPADAAAPEFVDAGTAYLLARRIRIGLVYANSPGRSAAEITLAVERHRRLAGFALGHQALAAAGDEASLADLRRSFLAVFPSAPAPAA